ncbi:mRNA splicing protein [Stachybotrys elegans]|uniref:mRNA splicing protein n=1 Tax=Stachybotrys elegans TaxID=80388 RepID=A0A8K0SYT9_9HYPO|nr:mRNA splicing protein [Stachybotrys elegans]
MSDFATFGDSQEEYAAVRQLNTQLELDPDNFDLWEKLIKACETLDGGLNRNSSPQALATYRDAYDRFLIKFPLLFGYWKKYADSEFVIAGPESAEMVYERGCASISNSVDLWTEYCSFKMETTHDPQLVRDLFERGASFVGLDFLAHPFWDKYIEYEKRQEAEDRIYALHSRIIRIPMHQYARYYERFRALSENQPLGALVPADVLARTRAEVEAEAVALGTGPRPELEVEREIRTRIDRMYYDMFTATQTEVTKRWTYESEIKRPYFHVTELENSQIANWRKYLDFEESEGDYNRIVCLYERCLVTCALYDEFWFRYARWMSTQSGKDEEVRNIYNRASTMFVPVSRPGIRLQWAYFEEMNGRAAIAADIHEAILHRLPNCVEVIVSWAHLQRRQHGVEAGIQVYKDQIDAPTVDLYAKAALVGELALMLWKNKGSTEEARAAFLKNVQWYADSSAFWEKWFQFEVEQPVNIQNPQENDERVKHVYDEMRARTRMSVPSKRGLSQVYLKYLVERGGKDAMETFLQVDREMFGPHSMSSTSAGGAKENGVSRELDGPEAKRAETMYLSFYQLHGEPVGEPQALMDYN